MRDPLARRASRRCRCGEAQPAPPDDVAAVVVVVVPVVAVEPDVVVAVDPVVEPDVVVVVAVGDPVVEPDVVVVVAVADPVVEEALLPVVDAPISAAGLTVTALSGSTKITVSEPVFASCRTCTSATNAGGRPHGSLPAGPVVPAIWVTVPRNR